MKPSPPAPPSLSPEPGASTAAIVRRSPLRALTSHAASGTPGEHDDPLRAPRRAHTYDDGPAVVSAKLLPRSASVPSDSAAAASTSMATTATTTTPAAATMTTTTPPPDAFESPLDHDNDDSAEITRASIELDDLPIELISLTDSFIESLFVAVHPTPPNIDNVARLFQDFYASASAHIQIHISALAARSSRSRERDAATASSSRASSTASRLRAKATSLGSKDRPKLLAGFLSSSGTSPNNSTPADAAAAAAAPSSSPSPGEAPVGGGGGSSTRDGGSGQQMLTSEELATRRRARRALEHKRILLEEAVERRLCEGIYDRIYRHRSTQDEAQDEKLRSKTAALALVGIGPAELGIPLGQDRGGHDRGRQGRSEEDEAAAAAVAEQPEEDDIRSWLGEARGYLTRMHQKRYPLGKLNMLKSAHKSIVETLSHFHPSASADEIMPMLIYALITTPPEDLNVISDARFMQRFRWEAKLTGEAAYCLTNLEAAISFLETVDLSTLREDEHPSGPGAAKPSTPATSSPPDEAGPTGMAETKPAAAAAAPSPPPSSFRPSAPAAHNRRISDLVSTPAMAINAASDVVFSTADQGLRTISSSLDTSYKFLFGRLLERSGHDGAAGLSAVFESAEPPPTIVLPPKTLDDARKLVNTPPPVPADEDDRSIGGLEDGTGTRSTATAAESLRRSVPREDRVLNLIGGLRQSSRDHSADSTRSGHSIRKMLFADDGKEKASAAAAAAGSGSGSGSGSMNAIESMRNLGNSLNPMARLSGIGMIRGFGRSTLTAKEMTGFSSGPAGDGIMVLPGSATSSALPSPTATRFPPPVNRFMEVQDATELKVGDVAELLREYRRLASALRELGAFEGGR